MSESKRTPGPWHVEENGARLWAENEDGSHVVATVERDLGAVLPPELAEARANAALIAAAPDLLDACIDVADELGDTDCEAPVPGVVADRCLARLRAAIRKARGES